MGPIGPLAPAIPGTPGAPSWPAAPCGPGGPMSIVGDDTTVSVTLEENTWPEALVARNVATVTPSDAVSVAAFEVEKHEAPSMVQQYDVAAPSGYTAPTSGIFAEPLAATTVWSAPALTVKPP